MQSFGVLFVCTGNICRSPTAEGVFRHYAGSRGLNDRFLIDSAGTHGYHVGELPDPRAIDAAAARGIRMDDLLARQLQRNDYEKFNLILAMDSGHLKIMQSRSPGASRAGLEMFMDRDVPDPYYGDFEDFERVLDMVEHGVEKLLDRLCREIRP